MVLAEIKSVIWFFTFNYNQIKPRFLIICFKMQLLFKMSLFVSNSLNLSLSQRVKNIII